MKNYIVYDIGGSSVKWSIATEKGEFLKSGKIKVPDTVEILFDELAHTVNKYKEEFELQGIAISAPGSVDSETGVIGGTSAIPYIHGPNFKEILFDKTGLNTFIENDANCAALGECWLGAAKEQADCAFVVCGTGIGGAIVKDKKIHKGIHKHGGEVGYCFVSVDVEKDVYIPWSVAGSTFALSKAIANRKGISIDEFDGLKAFQLYDEGDAIAVEEVNKFFKYMAVGIFNIQYTFDPEVIILGGAICEREGFVDEVNKKIDMLLARNPEFKVRPFVKKAEYGNDANKIGALYNLIQSTEGK